MNRLIGLIICLFSSGILLAQCGTTIGPEEYKAQKSFGPMLEYAKAQQGNSTELLRIPIRVIIFKTASNTPCTRDQFMDALRISNAIFLQENIEFYICQDIEFVENATYFNLDLPTEEAALASTYDQGIRSMNLYISYSLTGTSGSLKGKSSFPWDSDTRVFIKASSLIVADDKDWVMAHEFGHFLGLFHTFQGTSSGGGEDATRITANSCYNCTTEGDLLCDTPADPNDGYNPDLCIYDGGSSSSCSGLSFAPNMSNIMSYGYGCQNFFSVGQYSRMRDQYNLYYNGGGSTGKDLTCDCAPVEVTVGHDLMASHIYTAPTIKMSKNIGSDANVIFAGQRIILQVGFNDTGNGIYTAEHGCDFPFFTSPGNHQNVERSAWLENQVVEKLATEESDFQTEIFPNPTSGEVSIRFYISEESAEVDISIWDMQGRVVFSSVAKQRFTQGWQELRWNLQDAGNRKVAPGFYLIRIIKNGEKEVHKLMVQP